MTWEPIEDAEPAMGPDGRRHLSRSLPALTKLVFYSVVAIAASVVGNRVGGIDAPSLHGQITAIVCSVALAVFGVLATRAAAGEMTRVSVAHNARPAATALRVATLLVGYLVVGVGVLNLLSISLDRLLLGGAITGVIVGIAAQQALGNVFAGLVLLFTRPYTAGEEIRINSGALGGPFDGAVVTVDLMYTTLATVDGRLRIPNSAMLASAVGSRDSA